MVVETTEFSPRLFLIGAQKAGTTSLAYLLDQHPDIAVSNPKEPGFFAAEYERGLDWYRNCYPDRLPRILLDASTGYTMAPVHGQADDAVPRRIKHHAPDARFIYVLRDPVDRTISAYWHDRRAGRPLGSLQEAVSAKPFYTDVSRYHQKIALHLAHFPRERLMFVDFAELTANPVAVARRCIAFAGLDPDAAALDLGEPKNSAFQFNGLGRVFFKLFPDKRLASRFVGAIKGATPAVVHRVAKSLMTREPERIAESDRAWLTGIFAGGNQAMESITGFRFYR